MYRRNNFERKKIKRIHFKLFYAHQHQTNSLYRFYRRDGHSLYDEIDVSNKELQIEKHVQIALDNNMKQVADEEIKHAENTKRKMLRRLCLVQTILQNEIQRFVWCCFDYWPSHQEGFVHRHSQQAMSCMQQKFEKRNYSTRTQMQSQLRRAFNRNGIKNHYRWISRMYDEIQFTF